jgi:hypothetical protein
MFDETELKKDALAMLNEHLHKAAYKPNLIDFESLRKACHKAVDTAISEIIQQNDTLSKFLSVKEINDFSVKNGYGNHLNIKSKEWMTADEAIEIVERWGYDALRGMVMTEGTGWYESPENSQGEKTIPFFDIGLLLDNDDLVYTDLQYFYHVLVSFPEYPDDYICEILEDDEPES